MFPPVRLWRSCALKFDAAAMMLRRRISPLLVLTTLLTHAPMFAIPGFTSALARADEVTSADLLERTQRLAEAGIEVPIGLIADIRLDRHPTSALYELNLLESRPESAGVARFSSEAPLIAGSQVDVVVEYVAGRDLGPGSAIKIMRHWSESNRLQVSSASNDEFVSISSNVPGLSFTSTTAADDGPFGGLDSLADNPVFTLSTGLLPAGERVQLTITRLQLPAHTTDDYQLPLQIKPVADAPFVSVPGQTRIVAAGPLSSLSLAADSLVNPGEEVGLRVALRDQYGNLTADRALSLDLLINGTFRERIAVNRADFTIKDVRFDTPGDYQIEVRSGGGGLKAVSNPVIVSDLGERIVWLDYAQRSSRGDGIKSPVALKQESAGRYDVALAADHSHYQLNADAAVNAETNEIQGFRLESQWRRLSDGGSIDLLTRANDRITVASAENATDLRQLQPANPVLANIAAADSLHLWLLNDLAGRGYRVGVVGTNHSHQYHRMRPPVYTAISVKDDQHWFEALAERRSWVAVGRRILLLADTAVLSEQGAREFKWTMISDQPLRQASIYKNGEVYRTVVGEPVENQLTLALFSSSKPAGRVASQPRNGRQWLGYISTTSTAGSVENPFGVLESTGWQIQSGANSGRVDFLTHTHGATRYLDLQFDEMTPDTVFEIGLAPGFEDAAWLPSDRLPQAIAGQRFMITAAEIAEGATRQMRVGGYDDLLTLSWRTSAESMTKLSRQAGAELPAEALTNSGASVIREVISLTDASPARRGDYYYLHVQLMDGSYAISSPIYVGDF